MLHSANGAHAGARMFSPILPSDPVPFPPWAHGSYEGLVLVADQDRVMSMPERASELAGEVLDELRSLGARVMEARRAFSSVWEGREEDEGYNPAFQEHMKTLRSLDSRAAQLNREYNLRVIASTVLTVGRVVDQPGDDGAPVQAVVWPFDGDSRPDPSRPESWDGWSDRIIEWMAGDAQRAVRAQLQNPNSAGR